MKIIIKKDPCRNLIKKKNKWKEIKQIYKCIKKITVSNNDENWKKRMD